MNDEIMVSICCLVYNHEKYLRQCLDGFVIQKTNFKYEVLIHDDASTDGSADIIREYEAKYPDIIKPIYQTENQYSKGVKISWTLQYPRAKGKYIALCEGDDFWTDEHKLQKQFDVLEKHLDCVFCAHIVRCIKENGQPLESFIPRSNIYEKLDTEDWTKLLLLNWPLFQTSSYFFRSEITYRFINNLPSFFQISQTGDLPLMMLLSTEGNCYYIKDEMSCYRLNSIGSWTMRQQNCDGKHYLTGYQKRLERLKAFDEYTRHHFSQCIQEVLLITQMEYYVLQNNYRKCLQRKYRSVFSKLPVKTKIRYFTFAAFPWLHPLYLKLRCKK